MSRWPHFWPTLYNASSFRRLTIATAYSPLALTADRQSAGRLELCRSCHPWWQQVWPRDATDSRRPALAACSWAHRVQTLSARLQGTARPGSSLHQVDVCTSLVVMGPPHRSTHSARVRQAHLRIRRSNSLEQSTWHYTKRWIHQHFQSFLFSVSYPGLSFSVTAFHTSSLY